MRAIVAAFNAAHAADGVRVDMTFFPDFQYTEKISIAAAARDLPDAFDIDGPLVARYVDAGLLAPLDPWFDAKTRADFLPTVITQGTIDGKLYALGAFESAVVLYYDRTMLASAGVQPPPDGQAWTWDEFLAACARLRAAGTEPVALHMNDGSDEWFTYAFTPVIWSGGGALVSSDGRRVRGVLASADNVRSLTAWQQLFRDGYAATDPVDPDPFAAGRRHPVGQRPDVVLVHLVRLFVAALAHRQLHFEAAPLLLRVVQLGVGVADLHPRDVDFKAFDKGRIIGLLFRKRRSLHRVIVDHGRLDELLFHLPLENVGEGFARSGLF